MNMFTRGMVKLYSGLNKASEGINGFISKMLLAFSLSPHDFLLSILLF